MNKVLTPHTSGFVALLAAMCVSAVLLVLTVELGTIGWYTRFGVLGREFKLQSEALARSCLDQAVAEIIADSTYAGNATTTDNVGTCFVYPVRLDEPAVGMVTIRVRGVVSRSYTTLEAEFDMHDIRSLPSPDGSPADGNENLSATRHSWHEVP